MAGVYRYKDVVDALNATGFEEIKNNHGSHNVFIHKITGFGVTVPRHSDGNVAGGTAESILDFVTMQARISNVNIANDRYHLNKNVIGYIKEQHKKIKQDITNLVPVSVRKIAKLETEREVVDFVKQKMQFVKKHQKDTPNR